MNTSKTQWLERKILRKVLRNEDFTIERVYVGLTVAGVEISGGGYVRLELAKELWSEEADDGQNGMETHYSEELVWPKATSRWGLVDGAFLVDAAEGGNVFYRELLNNPVEIDVNHQFRLDVGSLIVHES